MLQTKYSPYSQSVLAFSLSRPALLRGHLWCSEAAAAGVACHLFFFFFCFSFSTSPYSLWASGGKVSLLWLYSFSHLPPLFFQTNLTIWITTECLLIGSCLGWRYLERHAFAISLSLTCPSVTHRILPLLPLLRRCTDISIFPHKDCTICRFKKRFCGMSRLNDLYWLPGAILLLRNCQKSASQMAAQTLIWALN